MNPRLDPPGRRLRVMVFCTHADLAGAPIHVRGLVEGLRSRIDFRVAFGSDGEVAHTLRQMGVDVEVIEGCDSALAPLADARTLVRLGRSIRDFRPDVLHVHSAKAGLLGRLAALREGIPHLYTVHGWGWRGKSPVVQALVLLAEGLLQYVPRGQRLFVAEAVRAEGLARLGPACRRDRVVWNSVPDPGLSPLPEGPPTFLMSARVCDAKDHETLVKAFERLAGPARLILCGEGTDAPGFQEDVRRWAPSRHGDIERLGACRGVQTQIGRSHAVVLASHYEAMPLSLLEGMAMGRPVAATRVGGNPEVIRDGQWGFLVDPGDVEGWRAVLSRFQDLSRCGSMGRWARARYEDCHSLPSMLVEVERAYQHVSGI